MSKRVPVVSYMVFFICGILLYFTVSRKRMTTKHDPHCPSIYWICRREFEFEFDVVNLDLLWVIWIFVVNLNLPSECEFTVVSLPQWIWICRCKFEFAVINWNFAVANLNFPWWIWNCQSEFNFAMENLNLLWRIWILHWWISNCRGEFEFAVANLNLPWSIWTFQIWILLWRI